MFRLPYIVAGSRDFNDYGIFSRLATEQFDERPVLRIVSGGARGVDEMAVRYAKEHGIPYIVFPADWNKYGRRAGYVRNVEMLPHAKALLAFWDGQSKGTKHMIDIARAHNLYVRVISVDRRE